jgi:hypothetical protein
MACISQMIKNSFLQIGERLARDAAIVTDLRIKVNGLDSGSHEQAVWYQHYKLV